MRKVITFVLVICMLTSISVSSGALAADLIPSPIPKPLPAGIPADNRYAHLGYLDVTLYGADPTGSTDSTSQIQKAIDDAYENQMVVFFPTGTYLVSDTLKMMRVKDSDAFRTRKGHVLEGSTVGPRPVIKLQDNSPGFQDPSKEHTNEANPTSTKAVVHFWTAKNESDPNPEKEDGANDYNQVFRGIDIDLGSGNPGAVGIRHKGAEGTSIQDVKITATKAFAGIYSLLGSGGSIINVEIIGGKYGIYATQVQPMPVITGIKMSEQEDKAIYYRGLTPLTIVGFDIQKSRGPVAYIFKDQESVESWGNIALIDGKILLTDGDGTDTAIQNTDRLVYLKNVYVKNAGKIVTNSFDETALTADNPSVWNKVEEYAYSKNDYPDKTKIINGVRTSETQASLINSSEEPPSDLVSRHVWDKNYWTFEDPDVINVEDYGAKGDGVTDDTQAIRAAITASEGHGDKVFIPRGHYKVSGTIKLLENTKLFGIARYLTSLEPTGWSEAVSTPIIESADSKTSTNVLANLKIELYRTLDNIYAIKWMAGRNSIESCVWICWDFDNTSTSSNVIQRVIITGNGGGRWYNHTSEIGFNTEAKGNRSVLVDGTTEPLTFYMFHNQHIKSDTISEVRNASNVTFYGVKTETQTTADPNIKDDPTSPWPLSLVISNSSNIGIYGYSGLGQAWKGRGLFEINDSKNITVANMVRWGPVQYNPDLWYYVKVTKNGVTKGIHADTPVNLVKIGTETWIEDQAQWASEHINKLIALGAIQGYPDGSFKMDNKITRAEFVKILVTAFKLETKPGKIFADTSKHWAKDYISTAITYGISSGYNGTEFGPDEPITREQMAVMVVNAAKLTLVNDESAFTDKAAISPWAAGGVSTAKKNGIMDGYPDKSFKPQDNATRAEAAAVLIKTIALIK